MLTRPATRSLFSGIWDNIAMARRELRGFANGSKPSITITSAMADKRSVQSIAPCGLSAAPAARRILQVLEELTFGRDDEDVVSPAECSPVGLHAAPEVVELLVAPER